MGSEVNRHASGMRQRRERILAAAAELVARDGIDGLTTRRLADEAGVTPPTLYNLIGSKEEILRQMFETNVESIFKQLVFDTGGDTLMMAENIIEQVFAFITENEESNRELAKALDQMSGYYAAQGDLSRVEPYAVTRSLEMPLRVCRLGIERGEIGELVPEHELAEQLFVCFRGPYRDWAHGLVSAPEMRRRQLRGFYIVLAGVGLGEFRDRALAKLDELENATAGRGD